MDRSDEGTVFKDGATKAPAATQWQTLSSLKAWIKIAECNKNLDIVERKEQVTLSCMENGSEDEAAEEEVWHPRVLDEEDAAQSHSL